MENDPVTMRPIRDISTAGKYIAVFVAKLPVPFVDHVLGCFTAHDIWCGRRIGIASRPNLPPQRKILAREFFLVILRLYEPPAADCRYGHDTQQRPQAELQQIAAPKSARRGGMRYQSAHDRLFVIAPRI